MDLEVVIQSFGSAENLLLQAKRHKLPFVIRQELQQLKM
jgi:hypothetical protein